MAALSLYGLVPPAPHLASHPRSSASLPCSSSCSIQYVAISLLTMESLPNELIDHVITHVARSNDGRSIHDAISLASCCLVSRRFYEAARPVLYSAIHLELMTDEPVVLLDTFKSNVQLATAVKSLFIQCRARCSTPIQHSNQLRDFLAEALPLFVNLTSFRSDHRIATIKLVETSLYHDRGYSMGIPVNLENIRTLELFAADYIYKYNYILRLPQLRRVLLHSMKIIDLDGDDRAYPDDWGWMSHSVKELEIHQGFRTCSAPYRLWSNSLHALARSLPALSYLRLFHYECTFYPRQSHHLLGFFKPQLRSSLRRLTIEDGRIDARHPEFGYNYLSDDASGVLEDITASRIESLSIDLHTLFTRVYSMGLTEAIHAANLPHSLRHLHLRHVEVNDMSSVGDTTTLLGWSPGVVVQELSRKCPALTKIDLEIRLLRNPNPMLLEEYKMVFASRGISFNVIVHECPAQRRTSIVCSRPA